MYFNIIGFFSKICYFGFIGIFIFVDNVNNGCIIKDIFGERFYEYLIKDVIVDENVFGFLVEYYGKWKWKSENDK